MFELHPEFSKTKSEIVSVSHKLGVGGVIVETVYKRQEQVHNFLIRYLDIFDGLAFKVLQAGDSAPFNDIESTETPPNT